MSMSALDVTPRGLANSPQVWNSFQSLVRQFRWDRQGIVCMILFCSMRKVHCWEKLIKAYLKTKRTSSIVHFSHIFCRYKHDDTTYFYLKPNRLRGEEKRQINKQNPQNKTTHSLRFPCSSRIKCSSFSFMKSLTIGIDKEHEMYLGQRKTQTSTAGVFIKARYFAGCSNFINVTMVMTTVQQ